MTDVSVTLRPPRWCFSEGHQHGVFIQSSINLGETLFPNTARMNNHHTDQTLGEVVYISISSHVPASQLNLLYGYDFYF